MWVAIEGVEGAGKSTLVDALAGHLGASIAPEFSSSVFGKVLESTVKSAAHFISISPIGQSMVFLGDFFEVVDAHVTPAVREGRTVISDRGPLMKYAYQVAVLETLIEYQIAHETITSILSLAPAPDLTVYLDCPLDVARRRLVGRDGACSPERLSFIERCGVLAGERLQLIAGAKSVIDATQSVALNVEVVAELVSAHIGPGSR